MVFYIIRCGRKRFNCIFVFSRASRNQSKLGRILKPSGHHILSSWNIRIETTFTRKQNASDIFLPADTKFQFPYNQNLKNENISQHIIQTVRRRAKHQNQHTISPSSQPTMKKLCSTNASADHWQPMQKNLTVLCHHRKNKKDTAAPREDQTNFLI